MLAILSVIQTIGCFENASPCIIVFNALLSVYFAIIYKQGFNMFFSSVNDFFIAKSNGISYKVFLKVISSIHFARKFFLD